MKNPLRQYLIISIDPKTGKKEASLTDWCDLDNLLFDEYKMTVIDLVNNKVSFDGKTWEEIELDHL